MAKKQNKKEVKTQSDEIIEKESILLETETSEPEEKLMTSEEIIAQEEFINEIPELLEEETVVEVEIILPEVEVIPEVIVPEVFEVEPPVVEVLTTSLTETGAREFFINEVGETPEKITEILEAFHNVDGEVEPPVVEVQVEKFDVSQLSSVEQRRYLRTGIIPSK